MPLDNTNPGGGGGGDLNRILEEWCKQVNDLIDRIVQKCNEELRNLERLHVPGPVLERLRREIERLLAELRRRVNQICEELAKIIRALPTRKYLRELAKRWRELVQPATGITDRLDRDKMDGDRMVNWYGGASEKYSSTITKQHECSDKMDDVFNMMATELEGLADSLDARDTALGMAALGGVAAIASAVATLVGLATVEFGVGVVIAIFGIIALIASVSLAIWQWNEAGKVVGNRASSAINNIQTWLDELPKDGWPHPNPGLAVGTNWPDGD